ncbi:hypothetical protein PENSPDRAFT_658568 [Peniophora sp. CONT]|nr:hypothetical protein PENSPDRAFT_658568 [Peniophora sp. CONT]
MNQLLRRRVRAACGLESVVFQYLEGRCRRRSIIFASRLESWRFAHVESRSPLPVCPFGSLANHLNKPSIVVPSSSSSSAFSTIRSTSASEFPSAISSPPSSTSTSSSSLPPSSGLSAPTCSSGLPSCFAAALSFATFQPSSSLNQSLAR